MMMNQTLILRILVILVWIGVGIIVVITIVYPPVDDKTDQEDFFLRTITGLECHQMERYILDMEERWDDVIQYHSFKCSGVNGNE